MKRTPLTRRTPMKRGEPLAPGKPMPRARIRPVRSDRRARLHAEQYDDPYAAWLRSLPCVCCGRWERGGMVAHHVTTRGAGGKAGDQVPMHWLCHEAGHAMGWTTFQSRRTVDLRDHADRLRGEWLRWTAPTLAPRPDGRTLNASSDG